MSDSVLSHEVSQSGIEGFISHPVARAATNSVRFMTKVKARQGAAYKDKTHTVRCKHLLTQSCLMTFDATDRSIIEALQEGLPLVPAPYAEVAAQLGLAEGELTARLESMKASGVIRRIAAAPNHYKLGMTANGMTVWDVDDDKVTGLGAIVGALPFVTHSYERPRALPDWPYNLFAMVHGTSPEEVEEKRAQIANILRPGLRGSDVLLSTRILKKTGLRLRKKG